MKRQSASVKLVLALTSLLVAACSSKDDRSLVVVDVQLAPGTVAPDTVRLTVSTADADAGTSRVVKTVDVPWSKAVGGVLEVGIFLPADVGGPVTITAQALVGGEVVATGALLGTVSLKAGASVGPLPLTLSAGSTPPGADGGTPDTAVGEAGGIDVTPSLPGHDADISEAPLPALDGGQADIAVDLPISSDLSATPDGPGADYPAVEAPPAVDAADGPAAPLDASNVSEAGQVSGWQAAQNVENDLISRSYYPSVVVDPVNEHVYVAWEETAAVKVKRWNRGTESWEKTITIDDRGSPTATRLGADGKGNVILSWLQEATGSDTARYGVWVSRTADGISWSPPEHVASGKIYYDPQLAVARNGTARIVYGRQTETNITPLFTAYYDGVSWTDNPTLIDPVNDGYGQEPRLTVDPSGNAILLFEKDDSEGNTSVAAVTMTGATFSAPVILDANTASYVDVDQRCAALNSKGEGVVVWSEYVDTINYNMKMYARGYSPLTGWGPQSPAIVASSGIYGVNAVLDDAGVITIAWQQPTASGKKNTMAIRGTLTGTWSDIAVLETDNAAGNLITEFSLPQLALDAHGNVLIAWRKESKTTDTTTFGAYASRYAGGAWLPQFQLGQSTGYNVISIALSVADSGLGAAAFVYVSSTGSTADPNAYNTMVALYR